MAAAGSYKAADVYAQLGYRLDDSRARLFQSKTQKLREEAKRDIIQKFVVDDERAQADLKRIDNELQRRTDKANRSGILVKYAVDERGLKESLARADALVSDSDRKMAASTARRIKGERDEVAAQKAKSLANRKGIAELQQQAQLERALSAQRVARDIQQSTLLKKQAADKALYLAEAKDLQKEEIDATQKEIDLAKKRAAVLETTAAHEASADKTKAANHAVRIRELEEEAAKKDKILSLDERKARAEQRSAASSLRLLAVNRAARVAEVEAARAALDGINQRIRAQRDLNDAKDREVDSTRVAEKADVDRARIASRLESDRLHAIRDLERAEGRLASGGRGKGGGGGGGGIFGALGDRGRNFFDNSGISTLRTSLGGLSGSLTTILRLGTLLFPVLQAVGGAAVALAGSLGAAAAGAAAVGVGFAAAIPSIGILSVALSERLNVIKQAWTAVKASELQAAHASKISGKQQQNSADAVRAATEGVTTAKQSLATAERDEKRTQEDLTAAQEKARREMEDLQSSAEGAALAVQRADFSLGQAVAHLVEVQDSRTASKQDLIDAQLQVKEARLARDNAVKDRKRANQDLVAGTTTVRDAQQRVADAHRTTAAAARQVTIANENLATSQRKSTQAIDGTSGAADRAKAALALLTGAERKTLFAVKKFEKDFHKALQPATDAIFSGVADAIDNLRPLLGQFKSQFTTLGQEIAGIFRKASKSVAGPEWTSALHVFADTTNKIIGPLSDAVGSIFVILRDVIRAATPYVVQFSNTVKGALGGLADKLGNVKEVRKVIGELVGQTESWGRLLGSVGRLLFDVLKGGARDGKGMVDRLTEIITGWDKFLESRDGQKRMKKFFSDSLELLKNIGTFIGGLYTGFHDTITFVINAAKWLASAAKSLGHIVTHLAEMSPLFKPLKAVADIVASIAGSVTGINKHVSGIKIVGEVLGGMAALKLFGLTGLVGKLITLGSRVTGAALKGVFSSLGKVVATGEVAKTVEGGAVKRGVFDIFKARGSFENPMYVIDLSNRLPGGGGKGPGGVPLPGGAKAEGELGKFGKFKGLLKGAGKLGLAAAAVDLGINLLDSKGNPIAATINSAHDLTFGIVPKVDAQTGAKKDIKELNDKIEALVKDKNVAGLKALGDEFSKYDSFPGGIDKARKAIDDATASVEHATKVANQHELAKATKETTDEVARQWKQLSDNTKLHLSDIRYHVGITSTMIKERLPADSAQGKKALADNFKQAADAVKRQMDRGVISTKTGMKAIRGYLVQELHAYGLTLHQASSIADNGTLQSTAQRTPGQAGDRAGQRGLRYASGGWLGHRGMVGDDTIQIAPHTWAAAGEYHAKGPDGGAVINRHQAPVVDMALRHSGRSLDSLPHSTQALPIIERAMSPYGGLDAMFASITRPHMLASGGRIGGAISAANRLEKASFPYLWGGGHQRSPAPFGPMDCSGAVSFVLQHAGVNIPTMTSGQLEKAGKPGGGALTVYANPEHTLMRIGKRFFGTSSSNPGGGAGWIDPGPDPNYLSKFTVRHFLAGSGAIRVPNPGIVGGGAVGRTASRALGVAARSATRTGNRAIARMGLGTGNDNTPSMAQGNVIRAFRQAVRSSRSTPLEALSLFEAGIVESGLQNLHYGDADSLGALQERVSIYGRTEALSPFLSAMRFLRQVRAKRPWGASAGSLAQAVQRSAFPDRYDKVAGQARRYLAVGGRVASGAKKFMMPSASAGGTSGTYFAGGGKYDVTRLRAQNKDRIGDYDAIMGQRGTVAVLQTQYETADRIYGQKQRVFVKDDGTLDEKMIHASAAELTKLVHIRKRIVRELDKAVRIARRVIRTYKEIIGRLQDSLAVKGAHRVRDKDRAGIKAEISSFKGLENVWENETLPDLLNTRVSARLDVIDAKHERNAVLKTKSDVTAPTPLDFIDSAAAKATLTPDTGDDISAAQDRVAYWQGKYNEALLTADPRDDTEAANSLKSASDDLYALTHPDTTADQQALLDQALARSTALASDLSAVRGNFAAFTSTGDLGSAQGTTAFGSAKIDAGGKAPHIVQNITVSSFVPPTGADLMRLGDVAVSGMNQRPSRPTTTVRVGG